MRKLTALLICCILLFTLPSTACGISFEQAPPEDQLLPADVVSEIFEKYSEEIRYVEDVHNTNIDSLTENTLALIKDEAIKNLSNDAFEFAELMDALACEFTSQKYFGNSNNASRTIIGDYYTTNHTTTTLVSYTALKGVFNKQLEQSSSQEVTKSFSIEVTANELIKNTEITKSFSISSTYTLYAPDFNTMLPNTQILATHSVSVGVLYGSIQRVEYDLVHIQTLETTHISHTVIDEGSADLIPYHTLANLGIPTYVQRLTSTGYVTYANSNKFKEKLVTNPGGLL